MANLNDNKLSIKQGEYTSLHSVPSLNDHIMENGVGTQADIPEETPQENICWHLLRNYQCESSKKTVKDQQRDAFVW